MTFVFGNPYAIRNTCDARVLVACYEDDDITQDVAADLLNGRFVAHGHLPVSVCTQWKAGAGLVDSMAVLPTVKPAVLGMDAAKLARIDAIAREAIEKKATPGCVVLVARHGKIAIKSNTGYLTYDKTEPVYRGDHL